MKVITRDLDFHPAYDMRSICELSEMLLFDIETTGLRKETTQVYLIGCVYYDAASWHVRQWLTENASDEREVLESFLEFAASYKTLVHFNGDSFDLPYLNYKADYYHTEKDFSGFSSYDIYGKVRKARRLLGMKSMSQRSLEEFLGIAREDRLNGGLLIPVYYDYEKSGSPDLEHLLLLHNFDDLQGMLKILPVLSYPQVFEDQYDFVSLEETGAEAVLGYRLSHPVPLPCETVPDDKGNRDIRVCLEGDMLSIRLKIYPDTGLLPLENVSDYYYLVEEDRVIHKDVAQFLDRSRRVKATKKNCFLKKEGSFVPQMIQRISPAYRLLADKKRTYAEIGDFTRQENAVYLQMAQDVLQRISSC